MATNFTGVPDRVVTSHEVILIAHYDGSTHTVTIKVVAIDAAGNSMSTTYYTDTGLVPNDYMESADRTNLLSAVADLHSKAGTYAT